MTTCPCIPAAPPLSLLKGLACCMGSAPLKVAHGRYFQSAETMGFLATKRSLRKLYLHPPVMTEDLHPPVMDGIVIILCYILSRADVVTFDSLLCG